MQKSTEVNLPLYEIPQLIDQQICVAQKAAKLWVSWRFENNLPSRPAVSGSPIQLPNDLIILKL